MQTASSVEENKIINVNNRTDEGERIYHTYLLGSKSIGLYGGYESFVLNLLQQHRNNRNIKYHVACKANESGYMDLTKLAGAVKINDKEFTYCNAHCFMIDIPEEIGAVNLL